jgi:hypothetical protein
MPDRRLGEVPSATVGSDMRREGPVRLAALAARGQFCHRGSRQRVPERKSPVTINTNQPRSLGGTEPVQLRWPGG